MKYILTSLILIIGYPLQAQKVETLPAKRLSIFKNGNYFLKRQGDVNIQNNGFYLEAPYKVLNGAYWLQINNGGKLKSIHFNTDTVKTQKPCIIKEHFFVAAIGKNISLFDRGAKAASFTGTLMHYDIKSNTFRLKLADSKEIIGNTNSFDFMQVNEANANTFTSKELNYVAKVTLDNAEKLANASSVSLHDGIIWQPSYLLQITDNKTAKLQLKATIVNGPTAFVNTNVDVVIGNPLLLFKNDYDVVSKLYIDDDNYDAMRDYRSIRSNGALMNQTVNTNFAGTYNDREDLAPSNAAGEKMEDLFFYKLGIQTLEANGKVIIPIYEKEINYTEGYSLAISESMSNSFLKPIPVKHYYTINNNLDAPFTAAPIMVLNKNENIQAHSKINYTPIGGKDKIELGDAIDVSTTISEKIVKKERTNNKKYAVLDRMYYKGTIKIKNFQNKAITIKVNKDATGKITSISDKGTSFSYKGNASELNETTSIDWEVTIAANSTLELTYEGNMYSRVDNREEDDDDDK
jgi:hypothetical protein